jgi:hypothetical protein
MQLDSDLIGKSTCRPNVIIVQLKVSEKNTSEVDKNLKGEGRA